MRGITAITKPFHRFGLQLFGNRICLSKDQTDIIFIVERRFHLCPLHMYVSRINANQTQITSGVGEFFSLIVE
jgi:hypothetical protein